MKNQTIIGLACLSCALLTVSCEERNREGDRGAGLTAALEPPDTAQVRQEIDACNTDIVDAWMTGQPDLLARCFTEDGALLRPGSEVVAGRDSIRAVTRRVFSRLKLTTGSLTTLDLHIVGDHAYETGKWVFEAGPVGGKARADSGAFLAIWKREEGKWKVWRSIGLPKGL